MTTRRMSGCVLAAVLCRTAAAQSVNEDTRTFTRLQQDCAEARKNQDVTFLERFYAAEFTVGAMDGRESTRDQDLSMFRSKELKPSVITDDHLVVHRYGEAALVTGTEHLEGTYRGNTGKFDLRFANMYVFRDGRWQIVRHQATPLQTPPHP